jgi:hypothetical protein
VRNGESSRLAIAEQETGKIMRVLVSRLGSARSREVVMTRAFLCWADLEQHDIASMTIDESECRAIIRTCVRKHCPDFSDDAIWQYCPWPSLMLCGGQP